MNLKSFISAYKKASKSDNYIDFSLKIRPSLKECSLSFSVINKDDSVTRYTTEDFKMIVENITTVSDVRTIIKLREPITVLAFLEGMLKGSHDSILISGNRDFAYSEEVVQHFIKGYSEFTASRSIELRTLIEDKTFSTFL